MHPSTQFALLIAASRLSLGTMPQLRKLMCLFLEVSSINFQVLTEIPYTFLKLKAPQSVNTTSRAQTERVFSAAARWCCCHCIGYNLKLVYNPCSIVKIIFDVGVGIEKNSYKTQGTDEAVLGESKRGFTCLA